MPPPTTLRYLLQPPLLPPHTRRLLQLPAPQFVLFVADDDPATGVSWCPDCVRSGPAVKGVMADKGLSLLEVLVGQRAEWKDPQHPLRWLLGSGVARAALGTG